MRVKSACVAVLNFNGIEHLQYLIPTLIKSTKRYENAKAIILDNCSTGQDVTWIKSNFPDVLVISAPKNEYLLSYNWLAKIIDEDVIVVLNNDLYLDEYYLRYLLEYFHDESVFAVTGQQLDWDGKQIRSGPYILHRHRGWYWFHYDSENQTPAYTLFASGGFSAIDRKKFIMLGGFDRLFHPGYCEDVDLCFRAWGMGWKSIYEPRAITRHRESGSFGKRAARLNLERMFLFHWRNLRHQPFYIYHHLYTLWSRWRRRIMGDHDWLEAYKTARTLWKERRGEAIRNRPKNDAIKNCMEYCGKPVKI